ncbi:MAG: ATP-dependent RNA helicase HrpA [Gammaproteobacteria bacterium]|nr:ATP-dependent RNA helicase HrpA [Gammaproteobacteria bacterium]
MLEKFDIDISKCLLTDQGRFRSQLERLRRLQTGHGARELQLENLSKNVISSIEEVNRRLASIPALNYPEHLPVSEKRELISNALLNHQVIILAGETGSGKTTQIPKICLELGYGAKGLIGHTQPRRLAARAVAGRIADELGVELGKKVGYQVRFSDNTVPETLVKLMTDGVLLAEIQHDRNLRKYEVLIIDEAHERSLNIDFLLGYLRQLLPARPDLKIVITSATIDVDRFSRHFNNAPIITISGRTFPVDIIYRPVNLEGNEPERGESGGNSDPLASAVLNALSEIELNEKHDRKGPGDVLVFLSGEREIRDISIELRKRSLRDTEVLPLYARLTPAEQSRIFAQHSGRRIILATNVAETSLTVPGIVYVIDSGFARISRYSVQSKVQRLPVERISQASANQRSGRCGRVSHGTCIRLYSDDDFSSRPLFTDPEIQRTNLSAVILQMLMLGLGNISAFPFIDKPDQKAINDGFKLLFELGAIDKERKLTNIGRIMAKIPADPRLARMLLEADSRNCLQEVLIIVSALCVQDPRDFPAESRQAARERHQQFTHPESDFFTWIQLWSHFESQRQILSQSAIRQYCKKNFLSFLRMREWRETHRQLHLSCQQLGLRENHRPDTPVCMEEVSYEAVHRSILKGSLNQLGLKTDDGFYLGSRGRKFSLFPTSCLFKKSPKWVVTAELIETKKLYATLAARIQPEWVVDAAPELLKREYSEVHWEKGRGQVVAYARISIFGLPLIERQRVPYSSIDPVMSREVFIREALVGRELKSNAEFLAHNTALMEELKGQEEKQRRPDLIAGDEIIYEYYAGRIPPDICDSRSLEQWLKIANKKNNRILFMNREDVLQRDIAEEAILEFPDQVKIQNNALPITYRFEPGCVDDGASIQIPQRVLSQLTAADIDWAIPGQVRSRCIAILKGLPKSLRKHFIPVPDFVDGFMHHINLQDSTVTAKKRLTDILRDYARTSKGVDLDKNTLNDVELPPYLIPRLTVVDDDGREVAKSLALQELQLNYSSSPQKVVSQGNLHPLEREGLTDWSFGQLPFEVDVQSVVHFHLYPALVDKGSSVSLVLQDNPQLAESLTRAALCRLLMFRTPQQRGVMLKRLRILEKKLALKVPNTAIDFGEESLVAIYRVAFELNHTPLPRDEVAFERLLLQGKSRLLETGESIEGLLERIVDELFQVRRRLQSLGKPEFSKTKQDIVEQIEALIYPGYLSKTPVEWLMEYPRYLKAIEMRIDKLPQQLSKDSECSRVVHNFQQGLRAIRDDASTMPGKTELRWMIEELRVSLYAQTLKTKIPISEKRIQRKFEEIAH